MLTIDDYQTIARIANAVLAQEYRMHALDLDPPTITPAIVRLVVSETNRYNAAQARKTQTVAAKPQPPKTVPRPTPKPAPSTPAPPPSDNAPQSSLAQDPEGSPFASSGDSSAYDATQLLDLVRAYSHDGIMFSAAMYDQVKPDDAPTMSIILYQLDCNGPQLAARAGLRYNPHHWKGARRAEALAAFSREPLAAPRGEPAQRVAEKIDEHTKLRSQTLSKNPATKFAVRETEAQPQPEMEGHGEPDADAFFRNGAG